MQHKKETVGFLLHDTARLMKRDFERRARHLGLTRAQWQTLFHLARNEGCNQSMLADLLEIEPITLARIVDRLEEAGLVDRRQDDQDRRCWRLHLGSKAHPLLEQLRVLGAETRTVALAGLSEAEQAQFGELLSRVRSNLSNREDVGGVGVEATSQTKKKRNV